jgi:hypothetical protein
VCYVSGLLRGRLGCGGRRRRKRHLYEGRWRGLESVGERGDVVAGEADERRRVGEGAGGDGRRVEFSEAGGRAGWALPCCTVDVGLRRVDGVGPGERGGVLRAGGATMKSAASAMAAAATSFVGRDESAVRICLVCSFVFVIRSG